MGRWEGFRPPDFICIGKSKKGLLPDGQAKSLTYCLDAYLGLATPSVRTPHQEQAQRRRGGQDGGSQGQGGGRGGERVGA